MPFIKQVRPGQFFVPRQKTLERLEGKTFTCDFAAAINLPTEYKVIFSFLVFFFIGRGIKRFVLYSSAAFSFESEGFLLSATESQSSASARYVTVGAGVTVVSAMTLFVSARQLNA